MWTEPGPTQPGPGEGKTQPASPNPGRRSPSASLLFEFSTQMRLAQGAAHSRPKQIDFPIVPSDPQRPRQVVTSDKKELIAGEILEGVFQANARGQRHRQIFEPDLVGVPEAVDMLPTAVRLVPTV